MRSQFLTRRGDACRTNWYPGTLADLAGAVGYLSEYELLQRNLSNSVHSTPMGLFGGPRVTNSVLLNHAWRSCRLQTPDQTANAVIIYPVGWE